LLLTLLCIQPCLAQTPDEEKVLNMYVAYGGPDAIAKAFEDQTGIKLEYLTMSSGEELSRLRAEKANPQADVWFGGDPTLSFVVVGLLVNEDRLKAKNLPLPSDWQSLTDPVYKDELLASNPNTSGTAYTTISGLLQIKGE
jgi:iron(III) transport system substrate-binding protein